MKHCGLIVVAGGLLGLALLVAQERSQPKEEPAPTVQRTIECRWKQGAIRIDGRVDEKAWDGAVPVKDFVVFWAKRKAKTATTARLLWDERYLYFTADMEDSDLYALVKERNGQTWMDDVFELFFKPGGAGKKGLHYYELQVNALNTPLELSLPSRGAGGYQRFGPVTRMDMESAVRLRGTLNDWKDRDEGWTVEGRIPWTGFEPTGGRPMAGAKWGLALCRYDYSTAFESPELSSTAPLTQVNFHQYESYGELLFVGP